MRGHIAALRKLYCPCIASAKASRTPLTTKLEHLNAKDVTSGSDLSPKLSPTSLSPRRRSGTAPTRAWNARPTERDQHTQFDPAAGPSGPSSAAPTCVFQPRPGRPGGRCTGFSASMPYAARSKNSPSMCGVCTDRAPGLPCALVHSEGQQSSDASRRENERSCLRAANPAYANREPGISYVPGVPLRPVPS